MGDLLGVVLSGAYVGAVLAASSLLARRGASAEATRKLVHIGLGGWWVVATWFFASPWWAAALPALFIAVNYYAYRKQRLSFMAREEGEDTPGTVYYAVSLAVLALYAFGVGAPYVGALGVFCMAFGDGFAAVAGKRFGRRRIAAAGGGKSYVGSAVMLGASFLACAAVLLAPAPLGGGFAGGGAPGWLSALGIAALLATAATLLELFSSDGLDNLFVPLGVTFLYVGLFLPGAPFAPVLVGVALSGAVAVASLRMRLLTKPGALGAVAVGALSFGIGGWPLWLLLMWFFGSSNMAAKLMARRAGKRGGSAHRKRGGSRKLRQVLANSVPFLVCALAYALVGNPWLLVVASGALAASTADTWASEVGVYSKNPPVNILTRRPMQRGLSGGVSPLGLAATVAGAAATAFLAMLLFRAFGYAIPTGPDAFALVIACGVAGSLVDSVLGARLQAKYRDADADRLVETPPPSGTAALVSGHAWVNNDAVNLMSGLAAVALGLLVVA